jgi:dTDP-4-amino-4,6-dideoxygalactose transaminase
MVVSPFGAPLDLKAWKEFEAETGIRVVIDAAAGFDTVRTCSIPAIVSLHATKVLGAGEGGFITTADSALLERIKVCSNFGFNGTRSAEGAAVNSKLSEYHAAVVLANLDAWPETRRQHLRILGRYLELVGKLDGVSLQPGYGPAWVTGTTNVVLPRGAAAGISEQLLSAGIETRRWWSEGCHVQPAFKDCPRTALPVTEDLGSRVLGLPHFPEMSEAQIDEVADTLSRVLGASS